MFNAHPLKEVEFELPKGKWDVLVDPDKAGTNPIRTVSGKQKIPASSGLVLKKK